MNTSAAQSYKGFRFPAEIISHGIWLYYRFSLRYRDVEELLAERGVVVTTKPYVSGVCGSGSPTPVSFGAVGAVQETSGSSTKFS